MKSNKTPSDFLDDIIQLIAESSVHISKTGLMSGKTGIAILLYRYTQYKNRPGITEYANQLIDSIVRDSELESSLNLDDGLIGIAWGLKTEH